jgi:Ca-activated chloride channel family protein
MRFAHPQMLWLLAVIPPLMIVFFWWSWRKRQQLVTQFIQARLLPALTVGISPVRLKLRLASLVLAVVCLILALARPQWGFDWEPTKQRGLDILVAIDTSKSMLAEDIAPNRLTRAKLAALDLMQQAKSDRLGLIAFAGTAFLQCPLTVDDTAFRQSVETLDVNILPQGGTALAEAIQTAMGAFKEGDNYKALVMLTDGEDHDSGAVDAAKKAAEAGLQIFAVGIGSAEGELLRFKDANGRTDYVRDENGNVVKSHLNEELLKDIAKETQYGIYLRLQGAKTIETLYQQGLARLPKSEHEEKLVRQYHERYHWPLSLGLILLGVEMLFPERKREMRKASLKPAKGLSAAAAAIALLVWPTCVLGSTSGALREYKQGNYDQALKDYEKLLQRHSDDPRLHFNAGAAAYRDKRFEQAAKEFDTALSASDLKLQELSYYNHGNTLFQLGEKNPDPTKRTETWKAALKDFESSLKLNPKDPDAKFNYEFVKKRLEELKQQQQQQKQSDQNKQDQKDQQEQQQNQQNQNSEKNQDQQKQSEQSKADQNKEQQNQQAQQQKQEQQQQEQQKQKEQQQAQQQTNQSPSQAEDKSDEKEGQAVAAGQMSPEQARQLLDAQKSEEHLLPIKPREKPVEHARHFKDW